MKHEKDLELRTIEFLFISSIFRGHYTPQRYTTINLSHMGYFAFEIKENQNRMNEYY
jgi:hypothetical protein